MRQAYNYFLRNLNSIFLQAPLLQAPLLPDLASTSPHPYNAEDIKDLLFFTRAIPKSLSHHHNLEERILFPALAALPGVPTTLLKEPVDQHNAFHDGIEELDAYCAKHIVDPDSHRWEDMESIIDSFAPALTHHLCAETPLLLSLAPLTDNATVLQCWAQTEKAAVADTTFADFYDVLPVMLGSSDRSYEFKNILPKMPWGMVSAVKGWFAPRGERPVAWRFVCVGLGGGGGDWCFLKRGRSRLREAGISVESWRCESVRVVLCRCGCDVVTRWL